MDRNGNNHPRSNSGQSWNVGNGNNSMYSSFNLRNNCEPRSDNQTVPLINMRTGISKMNYNEDFTVDNYDPAKSYVADGPIGSMGSINKTPKQIAFDNEFQKWEKSFEDWKLDNRNHPDPNQYRIYEQKFLEIREKLLKKRRELYGEETRSEPRNNPFYNQLNAADAMANSILSKFGSMSGNSGSMNNNNYNQVGGRRESGNSRNNDNRVARSDNEESGNNEGNGSKPKPTKLTPELDELIIKKRTLRRKWQRHRDSQVKTEVNNLQKIINEKMKELKNKD